MLKRGNILIIFVHVMKIKEIGAVSLGEINAMKKTGKPFFVR